MPTGMPDPTPEVIIPDSPTPKELERWAVATIKSSVLFSDEAIRDALDQRGTRALCGKPFTYERLLGGRSPITSPATTVVHGTIVGVWLVADSGDRSINLMVSGAPGSPIMLSFAENETGASGWAVSNLPGFRPGDRPVYGILEIG